MTGPGLAPTHGERQKGVSIVLHALPPLPGTEQRLRRDDDRSHEKSCPKVKSRAHRDQCSQNEEVMPCHHIGPIAAASAWPSRKGRP